jgi:uncharacterized membrane protein YhaH (DUF805 family)
MNWGFLFGTLEGRINRQPFWIGAIVIAVINIVASILDAILNTPRVGGATGVIAIIVNLVLIYPSVMLTGKRWHDRGKSAWWILIALIPIIGWIWAIVETGFLRGTPGANKYGPDPLG